MSTPDQSEASFSPVSAAPQSVPGRSALLRDLHRDADARLADIYNNRAPWAALPAAYQQKMRSAYASVKGMIRLRARPGSACSTIWGINTPFSRWNP